MSRVNRYEYSDWKNFGIRIKKYREEIGISKEKFAEMINRSINYVSYLEAGKTSASVHTIHQISKALKVSVDNILYGEIEQDKDYTNKEKLQNIINRCNENELSILSNVAIAIFPSFQKILEEQIR